MLSVNNSRLLPQTNLQQKIPVQQPALNNQTMQQDTVSFNGGMEKVATLTQTKTGKLGLAGLVLMTLLGVASTAKAHTLWANNGNALAHEHQIPGGSTTNVIMDQYGNWSVAYRERGGFTRNDPGDQEMMKVGRNQWQEVRRVFDENNNQKFIKYGAVIQKRYPVDPQNGFRIPAEVRRHFNEMDNGNVIIITPPSTHRHHRHHHDNDPYGIPGRDRAIERSFGIYE